MFPPLVNPLLFCCIYGLYVYNILPRTGIVKSNFEWVFVNFGSYLIGVIDFFLVPLQNLTKFKMRQTTEELFGKKFRGYSKGAVHATPFKNLSWFPLQNPRQVSLSFSLPIISAKSSYRAHLTAATSMHC